MLKNTNYYLVCTIHRLEKEKLENLKEDLTEISSTQEQTSQTEEFLPFTEALPIHSIDMQNEAEIQKELEASELADLKQEMIDQRTSLEMKIQELEMTIANAKGEKSSLEKELMSLKIKEFEEEMAEENNKVALLKG
jgi:hypothetical protein